MSSTSLLKIIMIGRAWRGKSTARYLATAFVGALFLGIGIAEYFGFVDFFRALNDFPEIKPVIIAYSLHGLFLFLFAVILTSILISGPFIYLNKKDTNFLLPLPIKNITIFQAHFYQQIIMSLWIALIFGIPAILSLLTIKASIILLFNGIFFFSVLIILAIILGNIFLLLLMTLSRLVSQKLNFIFISLVIIALGLLLVRSVLPKEIFEILAANNPDGNSQAITNLTTHYELWPSGWFTNILLSNIGYLSGSGLDCVWLLSATLIGFLIQSLLALKLYRPILMKAQENTQKILNQKSILTEYSGWMLLAMKEWLSIIRNRRDFGQFIFFIFLLGMYLGFIFNTKTISTETDPVWTPRIIMFIILTLCYFITLLALRFVFPLTSTERKESWFFYTMPRIYENTFNARIYAWAIPTVVVIEFMILLTAIGFGLTWGFVLPLMLLLPFVALFVLTLANTMGTVFPVKEKNNPEELSTTPQGLSFFVLVSAYTALLIWMLGFEIRTAQDAGYTGINIGSIYWLIIVCTTLFIALLWKKGNSKYKTSHLA